MFVDFFIKRPVFTSVCAIIILIAGAISIPTLPTDKYPEISPTTINVTTNYVGASAEVVEDTVTSILERQINGVEGIKYMTSSSSNSGTSTITITFDASRNKDIAAADVQNRVAQAQARLPEPVQKNGVTVTKQNSNILLAMGLYSEKQEYDTTFLSNYAELYIVDSLKRIPGVSDAQIFGARRYAMRLWLDPNRLASRNLTAQDVVDAVSEQNVQVGAGQIGTPPGPSDQMYQIDLKVLGRITGVNEFNNLVIKTSSDGTLVKLKDVGRAELGAENYTSFLRFRGQEGVGIGIFPIPGSNALNVAKAVKAEMLRLRKNFPPRMNYQVAFDTTLFIRASLLEVLKTLFEAIALVVFVIFIFLQDWRTTIIPVIVIPLALIGTFAFIKVFGFSINTLTMFGLTLATGLVVDDAIIVIENIARLIEDEQMPPQQAASESMRELSGAVIAISLVLMAVFVPVAFFPGSTGQIYRQFALTIAFSVAISTFLALTLTPALGALMLRRGQKPRGWLGSIFRVINRTINWTRRQYERSLISLNRVKVFVVLLFIVSLGLTAWLYMIIPTAFLPDEDQGYFITIIKGPDGVSLNYTSKVMSQVEKEILKLPEVEGTFAIGGFGFSGNTVNSGAIFTTLKPWQQRHDSSQSAQEIIKKLRMKLSAITEANVFPVNPPAIQGLGSFSGFQFELQDRAGNNELNTMLQIMGELMVRGNQTPGLQAVFSTFTANTPQNLIEIDRTKAKALQVSINDILITLQNYLGSKYVNDFNFLRRTYRVYVQADQQFRSNPSDIGRLYVRSADNQMIPLSSLVKVTPTTAAQTINHYNLFRSIEINGSAAPGTSSGQAIKAMEQLAKQVLPASFDYEWSGIAAEELASGGQAPLIFGLGLVFVFLVLAAQYENYVDPLIIMLAVPLAIFGALVAQSLRGFPNNVFCQVGLVMLIGLASKNAILIVEFANQLRERGFSITKAAIQAAEERLRPILMTSFAFILGIWPLVTAEGAGASSSQSLGTAVFGGMIVSTFLSLFIVPILYIVINTIRDRFNPRRPPHHKEPVEDGRIPSETAM
ncbi:efflux RND transporter permease subunit [Aetokthonos hydrillicola Thurmond2011]|jgi:HAE1 family hydrophobic/amphiphilic exporter-1|uniref:Efflux RND transporter permease subunit n=2 Tax=Aetokthonos TaxID=1550243 RepID=A0AAP5I939_9CYAN|nr:efflux RND transporter permease subunit [Aetokthonos hydrillicola]MBO3457726.1 efflux RND transporter permease subunit [Aetokthonos hydrillicola CCALA 1050]MBW4589423.1 efflux RND transporter permease subunit [Aetokthonos hydrillicola CCALA 1050]MDR9897100.1 efflux RND transporter permease subunit [Aetokthonos hydrillicola Thurmond2011]